VSKLIFLAAMADDLGAKLGLEWTKVEPLAAVQSDPAANNGFCGVEDRLPNGCCAGSAAVENQGPHITVLRDLS
jgi:hypothetical protein